VRGQLRAPPAAARAPRAGCDLWAAVRRRRGTDPRLQDSEPAMRLRVLSLISGWRLRRRSKRADLSGWQ
jgi:hypothetical protein